LESYLKAFDYYLSGGFKMAKKVETKLGQCPLCLEPVDPSRGDKIVLVWGKPGHFKCASRAHAKFEPYVEGAETTVEASAKAKETTSASPAKNSEARTEKSEALRKAKL
jgi:hypothetical protein